MNVISVDIDGVLNYYPAPWLQFIAQTTNRKFFSRLQARKYLGENIYSTIKDQYRISEYKANLKIHSDNVNYIRSLSERGYKIVISTSRPINNPKYPLLRELTQSWLNKNCITFDKLLLKEDSQEYFDKLGEILFHIDDELKYCKLYEKRGIKSYYLSGEMNDFETDFNMITPIIQIDEIDNFLDGTIF